MQQINKVGSVGLKVNKKTVWSRLMKTHRQFADETSFSFPDDWLFGGQKSNIVTATDGNQQSRPDAEMLQ